MGADATARFAIELSAPTGPSDNLAASLEKLRAKIQADQAELAKLQTALKNLQGGTSVNIEVHKNLQNQIAAKKNAIAVNTEEYVKLGGTFENIPKPAGEAAVGLNDVAGAATAAGGPIGGMIGRANQLWQAFQKLGQAFQKLGPAGPIALAVIVIAAIVTAAITATIALAKFALGAADAARSAALLREGATGSAQAGKELGAMVDQLSSKLATPRAKLEELGLALARSGLKGQDLAGAFSAIAMASAVMGDAAGSALQSIIDRAKTSKVFLLNAMDLKGTGLALQDVGAALAKRLNISVQQAVAALQSGQIKMKDGIAALDDATKAKFGDIAAKQMLGFGVQMDKLKENVTRLFADVNIEPFLKALKMVTDLFDQNTITGKALKAVFDGLLGPLFEGLGTLGPLFKGILQGMVIIALMFAISVLKVRNALRHTFGRKSQSGILSLSTGLMIGKEAVATLTILLGLLAVSMFLAALPFIIAGVVIAAVVYGIISAVMGLIDIFGEVYDYLSGLDFGAIADNIVNSLVNGLSNGVGALVAAAKNLAGSALNAIKATLGIASPSKEMMKVASFTTEGFSIGLDNGSDDVQASMDALVSIPTKGDSAVKGPKAVSGASGTTIQFNGDIYVGSKKELADEGTRKSVVEMFEEACAMAGLVPGGVTT